MKNLVCSLILISACAAWSARADITEKEAAIVGDICESSDVLAQIAVEVEYDKKIEKLSGVINLAIKRANVERYVDAFDTFVYHGLRFALQFKNKPKKYVDPLDYCTDVTTKGRLDHAVKVLHLKMPSAAVLKEKMKIVEKNEKLAEEDEKKQAEEEKIQAEQAKSEEMSRQATLEYAMKVQEEKNAAAADMKVRAAEQRNGILCSVLTMNCPLPGN